MKKVTVFSTGGGTGKIVESNATTWAELQKELTAAGVSHSSMKAVNGNNKTTLESPDASLGEGDFNLFLFPVKTKSGAFSKAQMETMSYGELRGNIKAAFETDKESANKHFNATKNYTNKSTADLKELLATYKGKIGGAPVSNSPKKAEKPATTKAVAKSTAKSTAKVPETKAVAKKTKNVADVIDSVAKKSSTSVERVESKVPALIASVPSLLAAVDKLKGYPENKLEAVRKALADLDVRENELDIEALAKQAKDLGKGIPGIHL